MFRTGIVRQHNTVRVYKLTDIVTSLWLGISKLLKKLIHVLNVWKPFNNIIVGINGCMSVNTLWNLITYYPMEGYSQQVN